MDPILQLVCRQPGLVRMLLQSNKLRRLFVCLFIKYLRSQHFSHLKRVYLLAKAKSWKSKKLENEDASCVYLKFKDKRERKTTSSLRTIFVTLLVNTIHNE